VAEAPSVVHVRINVHVHETTQQSGFSNTERLIVHVHAYAYAYVDGAVCIEAAKAVRLKAKV
jgi:hypothetical protein